MLVVLLYLKNNNDGNLPYPLRLFCWVEERGGSETSENNKQQQLTVRPVVDGKGTEPKPKDLRPSESRGMTIHSASVTMPARLSVSLPSVNVSSNSNHEAHDMCHPFVSC